MYDKDTGYSCDLKVKWNKSVNPSNIVQNSVAPVKGHIKSLSDTQGLENYWRQEVTDSQKNHILQRPAASPATSGNQCRYEHTAFFLHLLLFNSIEDPLYVFGPFPPLESE